MSDEKKDLATVLVQESVDVDSPPLSTTVSPYEKEVVYANLDSAVHEIGYDLYQKGTDYEWTPEQEKKILRKIDLWILPAFCITQGCAFLDKTALNYGNLFGMKADLHVTSSQFNWFASAFYLGYLVAAYPCGILLQKFHTGKVMGLICFFWGMVVMTTVACHNFVGAMFNRVILGILEAGVTPGLGLMTPFWWRLNEQPIRHLGWYCFNGVSGIIGDLVSYGLGHATNAGIPSWELIFLALGGFTVLWGVYLFFFLPDSPASARFFTEEEKIIAVRRVAENRTGTKNTEIKMDQVKEAFRDPKTYILFLASIAAQIPNGVGSNFSSVIISSFGFTKLQTTLLDIPNSIAQISSLLLSGWIAGRFKNSRCIMMFIGNVTCIIAAACLTYAPSDQRWGRLVAFWFTSFQSVGFSLSLVMISANVGGYTKRQTVAAATFVGYCVGNIAGPHVLIASEASEGYPTATKAMMSGYVAKTVLPVALGVYMWWCNKRWDRQALERGEDLTEEERRKKAVELGMLDYTEFNNKYFRYVL